MGLLIYGNGRRKITSKPMLGMQLLKQICSGGSYWRRCRIFASFNQFYLYG